MENIKAQKSSPPIEGAPSLDSMTGLCEDAMRDVNAVILEKMASDVPLIPELAGHLIAAGGKRMRPMLTLMGAMSASRDSLRTEMPSAAL